MSDTLARIRVLARSGDAVVSEHASFALVDDDLYPPEILAGLEAAVVVEDYPTHARGPCVLVLQKNAAGQPVHAVWGIPKGRAGPAVLITAYKPDPDKWTDGFTRRLQK
jgi:hypothetical protein